jgi:hypothetical protein
MVSDLILSHIYQKLPVISYYTQKIMKTMTLIYHKALPDLDHINLFNFFSLHSPQHSVLYHIVFCVFSPTEHASHVLMTLSKSSDVQRAPLERAGASLLFR